MILSASLIGGWDKLELWNHTHALLVALLFMVCSVEVVVWKMTNSLFTRSNHFMEPDSDYTGSDEFEDENIYYENLNSNYDQMVHRRQREQQRQEQLMRQQYADDDEDDDDLSSSRSFYPGHRSGFFRFSFF